MFLLKSDFYSLISKKDLEELPGYSDVILDKAILSAQGEVASYLAQRYDTGYEMRDIVPWASGTYPQYSRVSYAVPPSPSTNPPNFPSVYYAINNNVSSLPTNTTDWGADDRNPLLVTYTTDCALFLLYSKANPRFIPDIRVKRYDDAIAWLKAVRDANIQPGLKILLTDVPEGRILFGSVQPKQTMSY
jgi:phage gp36-like protein